MGLYLDTSCLLKLFFQEPESATVASQVAAEEHVVVSTLAHLELRVQIQGRVAGGTLSAKSATALLSVVDRTLAESPYEIAETPSNVYSVAAAQLLAQPDLCFCRGHVAAAPQAVEINEAVVPRNRGLSPLDLGSRRW